VKSRIPARQVQIQDVDHDGRGIFDFVCGELERRAQISRAVARGTVRLAMKDAYLAEKALTKEVMAVMVRHVLPPMLARRNIQNTEAMCKMIARVLEVSPASDFRKQPSMVPIRSSRRPSADRPSRP
jgi:hypothetical protein